MTQVAEIVAWASSTNVLCKHSVLESRHWTQELNLST